MQTWATNINLNKLITRILQTASSHFWDLPSCPPFLIPQHLKAKNFYERINQKIPSKSIIKKQLWTKLAVLWGNQKIQERLLHNKINMMTRCLWKLKNTPSFRSNIISTPQLTPRVMKKRQVMLGSLSLDSRLDILSKSKKIFKIWLIAHSLLIHWQQEWIAICLPADGWFPQTLITFKILQLSLRCILEISLLINLLLTLQLLSTDKEDFCSTQKSRYRKLGNSRTSLEESI